MSPIHSSCRRRQAVDHFTRTPQARRPPAKRLHGYLSYKSVTSTNRSSDQHHTAFYSPSTMSDYEDDEMDVDAPVVESAIQFSAESNSKGKRSAANLPVEAEDSMPWSVLLRSH